MSLDEREPGWTAELYVAESGPPGEIDDWTKVGGDAVGKRKQEFALDTAGQEYRYYLVWITELPDAGKVEIAEVELFR